MNRDPRLTTAPVREELRRLEFSAPDPLKSLVKALLDDIDARIEREKKLREALRSVGEEASKLIPQAAALVRCVGPDHWPEDAIPRDPVVVVATRVRDISDNQHATVKRILAETADDE